MMFLNMETGGCGHFKLRRSVIRDPHLLDSKCDQDEQSWHRSG